MKKAPPGEAIAKELAREFAVAIAKADRTPVFGWPPPRAAQMARSVLDEGRPSFFEPERASWDDLLLSHPCGKQKRCTRPVIACSR